MIDPRTLKGFRDFLPRQMLAREALVETARRVYRAYGFVPIETPALEYAEILLGKGGAETDKQLFRFSDQGGRDVAMRFDLTVPLARYVAQHAGELAFPFKRYHIATVWRGEKPQRGRFREFMQCDFDTVGTESAAADAETVLVIHDLLVALGFERFRVCLNHRKLLAGVVEGVGLGERADAVLRALDKLHKLGSDAVRQELVESAAASADQAERVLELARLSGSGAEKLARLEGMIGESPKGREGLERLRQVLGAVAAAGVPEGRIVLDTSIARGLDYYTDIVFETFLGDLPAIGSVCSGGRYANLAELYTKQHLPGVGASLGLDRLLAAMEELGMLPASTTPAPVFVPYFVAERLGDYLAMARRLHAAGIGAAVYPEPVGLGKQLKYADRCGFRLAAIAGEDEFARGTWQLKDLASGASEPVPAEQLPERVAAKLGQSDEARMTKSEE